MAARFSTSKAVDMRLYLSCTLFRRTGSFFLRGTEGGLFGVAERVGCWDFLLGK